MPPCCPLTYSFIASSLLLCVGYSLSIALSVNWLSRERVSAKLEQFPVQVGDCLLTLSYNRCWIYSKSLIRDGGYSFHLASYQPKEKGFYSCCYNGNYFLYLSLPEVQLVWWIKISPIFRGFSLLVIWS